MKKSITFFLALFCICSFGQTKYGNPEVNPTEIQKSFQVWNKYQTENIMLSTGFIALDENSKEISKSNFLDKLAEGNFIPIRLQSNDKWIYYKLFKIETISDSSIKATISESAFNEIQNSKKEGKPFPMFSFKDLNGNLITNENMKDKIVVIKCWYIHCANCIKEFPFVNQLVEKYKDRKDIIFLSLAEDTPAQLNTFLAKKPLKYLVVPNMKIYMNETLELNAFPTHFIVDKNGIIAKVLPDFRSLEVELEKM